MSQTLLRYRLNLLLPTCFCLALFCFICHAISVVYSYLNACVFLKNKDSSVIPYYSHLSVSCKYSLWQVLVALHLSVSPLGQQKTGARHQTWRTRRSITCGPNLQRWCTKMPTRRRAGWFIHPLPSSLVWCCTDGGGDPDSAAGAPGQGEECHRHQEAAGFGSLQSPQTEPVQRLARRAELSPVSAGNMAVTSGYVTAESGSATRRSPAAVVLSLQVPHSLRHPGGHRPVRHVSRLPPPLLCLLWRESVVFGGRSRVKEGSPLRNKWCDFPAQTGLVAC